MAAPLKLVSHRLCPYVQRVAIALAEKGVAFERLDVDLADKPDWFRAISPLDKTPVLLVGQTAIFESAVILEYLEDTLAPALHPADPLARAEHRAWIEFGSATLADIAGLYAAPDAPAFADKAGRLAEKFRRLEDRLDPVGPWFDGARFSLVDAVFAAVFRYFDAFDRIGDFCGLQRPRLAAWRRALAARPSAKAAVGADYPELLWAFLLARNAHLSRLMAAQPA